VAPAPAGDCGEPNAVKPLGVPVLTPGQNIWTSFLGWKKNNERHHHILYTIYIYIIIIIIIIIIKQIIIAINTMMGR